MGPTRLRIFIIAAQGDDVGGGAGVGVDLGGLGVLVGWGLGVLVGWGLGVFVGCEGGDVSGGLVGFGLLPLLFLVGVGVRGGEVRTGAGVDVLVAVGVRVASGVGVKGSSAQCPGPVKPVL